MSRFAGEDIDIKGPTGEITFLGNGKFKINDDTFHFDKVNTYILEGQDKR